MELSSLVTYNRPVANDTPEILYNATIGSVVCWFGFWPFVSILCAVNKGAFWVGGGGGYQEFFPSVHHLKIGILLLIKIHISEYCEIVI